VRGGIKEYNQASGAFENVYWTVPKGSIGGSVWTSPASKGPNVWIATGNAEPGGIPGDSFAIVRLSVSLVKQELFVVPVGDDLDFGASPTLFSATLGGVKRSMIGACNKNGRFYAFTSTGLANGPVWTRRLGDYPGAGGTCLAAAIWDGADGMLIAGSNQTTIDGVTVPGSLRALDPDTGVPIWKTALPAGPVMGSPSMNGAGIVAAGTYVKSTPSSNVVYLVDASDGTILRTLPMTSPVFAQPVFAGTHLFIATNGGKLIAYAAS
jgi:polyvinyl alcohol dehydrogenase (cytochrome)